MGDAPDRILTYARENVLDFTGSVYDVYLHDEIIVDDYDQFLIQMSVTMRK
ncbi:MAG: hypothetical protein FWH57_09070 [Oscillospiraceae bacterium]|nr:hypothetical protein [Oscillospiraceae bacterium]